MVWAVKDFDSTLGYPGEGPDHAETFMRVRRLVDETARQFHLVEHAADRPCLPPTPPSLTEAHARIAEQVTTVQDAMAAQDDEDDVQRHEALEEALSAAQIAAGDVGVDDRGPRPSTGKPPPLPADDPCDTVPVVSAEGSAPRTPEWVSRPGWDVAPLLPPCRDVKTFDCPGCGADLERVVVEQGTLCSLCAQCLTPGSCVWYCEPCSGIICGVCGDCAVQVGTAQPPRIAVRQRHLPWPRAICIWYQPMLHL